MKILVTGASGLLGKKLLETAPSKFVIIPTYHSIPISHPEAIELDITDKDQTRKVITKIHPELIIHSASLVYVDECEKNEVLTKSVNTFGTQNILSAAKQVESKLLFCSTNGIFDGTNAPYEEQALGNPVNVYGKTKYEAECLVRANYEKESIILRFNTMFGWNNPGSRENPVTWLLQRLIKKQITYMVTDVYNSHLWVGQAVQAIWKAIEKKLYGEIFHIGGSDCMNRYIFSQTIADIFGYDKSFIKPVVSKFFPGIAPRPKNTCFNTTKMKSMLGINPLSVGEGLKNMKHERYN